MRSESGTFTLDETEYSYTVKYPDAWCMAFNPQKIIVNIPNVSAVDLSINGHVISVALYDGEATIDISRLIQLAFTEPEKTRYLSISLLIKCGVTFFTRNTYAVWGAVNAQDTFLGFGKLSYNSDYQAVHTRRLAWFKNLPFNLNLFRPQSGTTITAVSEDGTDVSAQNRRIRRYLFDDIANVTETSGSAEDLEISEIVFDTAKQRFLGKASDGNYYAQWNYATAYRGASTEYNTEIYEDDWVIRADDTKKWLYQTTAYHYDSNREALVEDSAESMGEYGIISIEPDIAFPTAKRVVKYEMIQPATALTEMQDMFSYALRKSLIPDVFDKTFDSSFHPDYSKRLELLQYIVLDVKEDTCGYYLRWIDRFGFIQYFLFDEGDTTKKITRSKYEIEQSTPYNDIYYPNHSRALHTEEKNTVKLCAVDLNSDYFDYVSSIAASPIIDLYVGKQDTGKDLWIPVKIEDASFVRSKKPELRDMEITLALPDTASQYL